MILELTWEYITIGGILFLTWYDNLWLKKLSKVAQRKSFDLFWFIMLQYTNYQDKKNDMIKDGYHVDDVNLYIHEKEFIKVFEVLSKFRKKIVEGKIRLENTLDIYEFLEMCTSSEIANFKKINKDNYHLLEVDYTFDFKKYKIFYDTNTNTTIRFPVYSEKEVRERDIFEGGITSAQILINKTDIQGIDVTEKMQKFAGPMQNFYDDRDYQVKKEWFWDESYPPMDNAYIQIIDFKGNEHFFGPEDEYLTFIEK